MKRFFRYQLRTLDVDAARAFYAAVLGYADPTIVQLHEAAAICDDPQGAAFALREEAPAGR